MPNRGEPLLPKTGMQSKESEVPTHHMRNCLIKQSLRRRCLSQEELVGLLADKSVTWVSFGDSVIDMQTIQVYILVILWATVGAAPGAREAQVRSLAIPR